MGACFSVLKRKPSTIARRSETVEPSRQDTHELRFRATEDAAEIAGTSHPSGRTQAIGAIVVIDSTQETDTALPSIPPSISDSHQRCDTAKVADAAQTPDSVLSSDSTSSGNVPLVRYTRYNQPVPQRSETGNSGSAQYRTCSTSITVPR